ncbi:MAG: late competence development ComFB family protein [Clostridiaceae bacterium]|nr:late competence development ComFB family protein [Clostridiaceae bacterium]
MEGLTNLMEETVLHKISQLWPQTNFCQCDQCRLDVAAYALNRLPARYVRSLTGSMLHKFDAQSTQMDVEITAVVYKAIEIIGEEPHKNQNPS